MSPSAAGRVWKESRNASRNGRDLLPALDVALAALAAATWYVSPLAGAWPLIFIGAGWGLRWLHSGSPTRTTPLDVPLALFLLSAWLSATVSYSQAPEWAGSFPTTLASAWAKYWVIVGALGVFYALANLRSAGQLWGTLSALALFGMGGAFYFVSTHVWQSEAKVDSLGQFGEWLSTWLPTLPGRRLHPNLAGGLVAMLSPFCVPLCWHAVQMRRYGWAALWGVVSLVLLLGLLLTQSRGAWLALLVTALLWIILRYIARRMQGLRFWLAVAAGAVAALALAGLWAGQVLALAPVSGQADGGSFGSVVGRLDLWRSAWSLAQHTPFTGAGLGSFAMLYSTYELFIPVFFIGHSHNIYLDILVEQGVPGLALFVAVTGLTVWTAACTIRRTPQGAPLGWIVEASLASLGVLLLHGLVDDFGYSSRGLLLLFAPAGLIVAASAALPRAAVQRRSTARRLATPWIAALVVVFVLLCVLTAGRAAIAGMWQANLGALAQAQAELSAYRFPDRIPDLVREDGDESAAIAAYSASLAYDPANITANQRLGGIALARRHFPEARVYLLQAYAADPDSLANRQLLGDAELAMGNLAEAFTLWSRVPGAVDKLRNEAGWRYDRKGDALRAGWARTLAERIAAAQRP